MSGFEKILIDYFKGDEKMTEYEKEIIRKALINYELAIQDELTQEEHTAEEVKTAFQEWNATTKLIAKYSK